MENIVNFLEQFFIAEAKMATLKRIPNIENFNNALDKYFKFLVPQLRGATGFALENGISRMGGIGVSSLGTINKLGNCAEFTVGNALLKTFPKYGSTDIWFTRAIRPRNMSTVPTCTNCKLLFGL